MSMLAFLRDNFPNSWHEKLHQEFDKEYFYNLSIFLDDEYKQQNIFPKKENIFNAFKLCSFEEVKVVIIGQDPYHGQGQAMGLAFSVPENIKLPPSLKNIYKELVQDLKVSAPKSGDLTKWAEQGVLLLNCVLTVQEGLAASHRRKGWELFTDQVINILNQEKEGLVFMLWGNDAQKKAKHVDESKHLVLKSGHPSPLSVRFFRDHHHFSKANKYLSKCNKQQIRWI